MKFIKLFIFGLLMVSVFGFNLAFATDVSDSVTVIVKEDPSVTATLKADVYIVEYNTATVLHISSTGATSCTLSSNGINLTTKTNASWDVNTNNLTTTTKYDLSCKNDTKSATDTKTITVKPAPTCSTVMDSNYGIGSCSGTCKNSAANYPTCTTGGDGKCLNGATNPQACNNNICTEPNDTNYNISTCSGVCKNNADNYPTCTTKGGVCLNGATNPTACNNFSTMSGSINAYGCEIPSGNSSCPASISWSTSSPEGTSGITTPPSAIPFVNGNSGTTIYNLGFGSRTFFLYNNAKPLDQVTISAICVSGNSWDASTNKCVVDNNNDGNGGNNGSGCSNGAVDASCSKYLDGTCVNGSTKPDCSLDSGIPASNPQVLNMDIIYPATNGTSIRSAGSDITSMKIPYNAKVGVSWSSSDASSCVLSSVDSKGFANSELDNTTQRIKTSPYISSGLKRNTTYTVTCTANDGNKATDRVTVQVSPISAGYIEQ